MVRKVRRDPAPRHATFTDPDFPRTFPVSVLTSRILPAWPATVTAIAHRLEGAAAGR
jgi:hypothetical protein